MPSENDELLARISQLAGQINRHKASVASSTSSSRPQHQQPSYPTNRHQPYPPPHAHHASHASHRGHGSSHSWAPTRGATSYRSRGRGGRQMPSGHRNRTLVLNSSAPASGTNSRGETPTTGTDDETMTDVNDAIAMPTTSGSNGSTAAPNSGSWVAKRDRHMQLINSSVYDQHLQTRAKAIEQTRQDKLKKKEESEKAKLRSFLQGSQQYGIVNTVGRIKSKPTNVATYQHEIVINGARYKITVDGSKLVKVSDDAKKPTPKTAVVGGVTFYRSKGGNLWRAGVVRRQQRSDQPAKRKIAKPCKFFTSTGKCVRGNTCPYVHDPDRVAICPKFLQNNCSDGDSCDLSHIPNPHRVPACLHFLRGNCSNESCKYAHVRVNPSAPICRPFAKEGYCDKGADCLDKHVFECPDFDAKGVCNDKACKLPHIEHAGRRRAAAAAAAAKAKQADGDSDVSSDEDEEDEEEEEDQFGSDDVDSDYFSDSEVILQTSDDGHEVSQQADFIRF
ncbi:hypothetical protein TWF970_005574 [Orbilia oligospora]|uniref:C3H1-type domain-containing protein n=1 Tax=Orbilia oligospora TaxID=2813651 RepID=A0A7C8RJ86_ORBOL|nr:hypothetical protein TWF970_005574 [Orbilia oligospora]